MVMYKLEEPHINIFIYLQFVAKAICRIIFINYVRKENLMHAFSNIHCSPNSFGPFFRV